MAQNDFFLDFGSNADLFAESIKKQLGAARTQVVNFKGAVDALNKSLQATARISGDIQSGGGGGSGGGSGSGGNEVDWRGMARDIAEYNGVLSKSVDQIAKIAKILGPITKEARAAQTRANNSEGGRQSLTNRLRDPQTGRLLGRGAEGVAAAGGGKKGKNGALVVDFASTPKVLIEEAAFDRVVKAIEKNTAATKDVAKAVRSGGGTGTQSTSGRSSGSSGTSKAAARVAEMEGKIERIAELLGGATDEQRKALGAALVSAREELAGIREESSEKKKLRSEKKAERRAEAQANREAKAARRGNQSLSQQQRANISRDLDLGASEEVLRKLAQEDLRRVAQSYVGEGFSMGFDPNAKKAGGARVTNERLVQAILEMNKQLQATGKTFHDLSTKGRVTPDSITKQSRVVLRDLLKAMGITPGEQQAYDIRRQDRRSGGTGEQTRGRAQFGGDFQQGDANRWVTAAEALINQRNNERIPKAAINAALQAMQKGYNVYDPALRAGIQGKGEESREARRALRNIQRATDAIDKAVAGLGDLPAKIERAQANVDKLSRRPGTQRLTGNFENEKELAGFRRLLAASVDAQKKIDAELAQLRGTSGGRQQVPFDATRKAQLKEVNDLIRQEVALRRNLRSQLASKDQIAALPKDMQGDALAKNARLNQQITESLAKSRTLNAAQDNLRDIKAGRVKTDAGQTPEQQARIKQLLARQAEEIAARKKIETEIRKLSVQTVRDTEATAELTRAKSKLAKLLAQQAALAGKGAFLGALANDPQYQAGAAARRAPQEAAATARERRAQEAYARQLEASAQTLASAEALAGNRTRNRSRAGGTGDQYADFTRGLPGLAPITRGRRSGELRAVRPEDVDPEILKQINAAKKSYDAVYRQIGQLRKAEVQDVEQIAKLEKQAFNDLTKLVNAYNKLNLMARGYEAANITLDPTTRTAIYTGEVGGSTRDRRRARVAGQSAEDEAASRAYQTEQEAARRKERAARRRAARADQETAENVEAAAASSTESSRRRRRAAVVEAAAEQRANVGGTPAGGRAAGGPSAASLRRTGQAISAERQAQDLAELNSVLSQTTRREVELLRSLHQTNVEGKNNVKIAEQQVKVYALLNRELSALGRSQAAIRQSFQTVDSAGNNRATLHQAQAVARSANQRGLTPSLSSMGQAMGNEADSIRDMIAGRIFGNHGFWGRIANSTGTFIIRNFSAGIVFGLTAALSDVVRQAIITESTFIRVSQALEATGRSTGDLRTQLQGISTDYGVALEDVYESAAGLVGLFDSVDEIAGATRISAQLQMISNGALNAKEAMGTLASITSAFGELSGVEGLQHIADVLTVIQNRLGVNIEVTAEGVGRLSGLAQQIGLTFEETAVYVGEIAKKTNQTGAAAGEQFSRIIAVMQTGRGQAALTEALGDKGIAQALNVRDYSAALKILMANYQDLTKVQQDNIAVTLGGQRQAAALAALLKDGAGALDTITAATYARGEAEKRAAEIAEQLNVQMQKLQSNFVNFGAALVRSGILDVFGAMLIGINSILSASNHLLSLFNDFTESTPFLNFISKATLALIGLSLALKVVRAGVTGLRAYMRSDTGGGQAARGFVEGFRGGAANPNSATAQLRQRWRDRAVSFATRGAPVYGPMENPNAPRRTVAPVTGRFFEAATARPLTALSSGAERAAAGMRTLIAEQRSLGVSTRRTELALRALNGVASGTGRAGAGMQNFLRGGVSMGSALAIPPRLLAAGTQRIAGLAGAGAVGSAIAGNAGQARVLANVARGASVATSSLTRLSSSMLALRTGALTANVGMMALTAGIILLSQEFFRAKQMAEDVQNAYEGVFTAQGKMTDEQKAESYVGPATDLVQQNRKGLQGAGGFARAWSTQIMGIFKGQGLDEISARNAGDLSADVWNQVDKPFMDGIKRLQKLANDEYATINNVTDAAKQVQDDIAAEATRISEDDTLSSEQKATALAALESSKKKIEEVTSGIVAGINGLADVDQWTGTRIDEIVQSVNFLASNPTAGASYGSAVQALLRSINVGGLGEDSQAAFRVLTDASASTQEKIAAQLAITNTAIANAESALAAAEATGEEEKIKEASQRLQTNIQTAESLKRQALDVEIATVNEIATAMAGIGDWAGAEAAFNASADKLRQAVEASRTNRANQAFNENLERNKVPGSVARRRVDPSLILGPEEEQRYLNQAAQLGQSGVQNAVQAQTEAQRQAIRGTRNAVEIARIQRDIAQTRLEAIQAAFQLGNATAEQVEDAEQQAIDAGRNLADQAQATKAAGYAARAAGTLNQVSRAQIEESGAFQALAYARSQFGTNSAEYLNALSAARSASQATTQALLDQLQAQRETELAMIAPQDTVSRARKTLANAQAAQRDASRFGTSSVQYQQATQQVIEAQRQVDTAIFEIADANSNLAIVMAQAAGKTVDVARLKLEQALVELDRARQQSGGQRSASVINAEAAVKQAQADQRDAILQDRLDSIDFMKNMEQITSQGAISMLTELLNMKDLTEQQRRDILLRIKGLQDELSSSLEGAFNLPDTIKPPTVYEVRRALGIDDYLRSMKDATDVSGITGAGAAPGAASQILREIQQGLALNGSAVPSQSQDYSNSNNTVNINGASFEQVIAWLQQYLGQGAQVVRTVTPRRY